MIDDIQVLAPRPADAFVLGALHLQGHHAGQQYPAILLEDLSRLLDRIDHDALAAATDEIFEAELAAAFTFAVEQLTRWRPTLPTVLTAALRAAPFDRSTLWNSSWQAMIDDLDLLTGDAALDYLRELLFPPADYLRTHYGVAKDRPRTLLASIRLARAALAVIPSRRSSMDAA